MNTYVKFERPRDDADGPELGPFEWVQLTYTELRVSPEGETLAMFGEDGDWHIGQTRQPIDGSAWSSVSADLTAEPFSDVLIYQR